MRKPYKTKFKAYSMEGMPDVVSIWGQPAFLDEVLDAGVLAELNQDDYKDYGFISGSLDGFMKDGKLYGLPRNTDVAGFYYNQKMFEDNGWEASMALNEDIPEEIRTNIRVFTMLVIDGGKGTATDIAAWNGGGYAVSADSEVKEEAVKFLNYMYQPDKLSKYGWENGVGMSAQDQSAYMTGDETELQMQFVDAVNNATSVSGTPINDCGPSAFKTSIESEIQSVSNRSISLVLPGLLLFFFAILAPICLSVYYGFTEYSGMGTATFIGMENYKKLMTDNVIWSVLIVLIWHGFGWGMLIYYTGIKNIDPVLYEAAAIDGADQKRLSSRSHFH